MLKRHCLLLSALASLLPFMGCGGGGSPAPAAAVVRIAVSPQTTTVPAGGLALFFATVTGSSNHTVTWQVNGAAGGNATVGTIDASGAYTAPPVIPSPATVTVTAVSQADSTKNASASVTVVFTVSPPAATLNITDTVCNSTQQFTALGAGSAALNWTVPAANFGTIDATGLYTAPDAIPDPTNFSVTATSQTNSAVTGSAIVTLQSGGPGINQANQLPTPISLGTTGGNVLDTSGNFCCSGTLGSLVTRGGKNYILSNNHVLARSGLAHAGESIGHPGLVDNACNVGASVATFSQAVTLNHGGTSAADAAIAQIVTGQVDPTGAILGLGPTNCGVAGAAPPASTTGTPTIGMSVAKSGRTTGITCGTIAAVNTAVEVDYDTACGSNSTFTVDYDNQIDILSATFSAPGDSGSLIVDAQTAQPVGLLYAGSPSDTVANPIQAVLSALADPSPPHSLPTFVGGATHTVPVCTGTLGPFGATGQAGAAAERQWPSDEEVVRATNTKNIHAASLMSDRAVIGVGVGAGDVPGEATIVIFVDKKKAHGPIPALLDGIKTKVRMVERFHAFSGSCPSPKPQATSLR